MPPRPRATTPRLRGGQHLLPGSRRRQSPCHRRSSGGDPRRVARRSAIPRQPRFLPAVSRYLQAAAREALLHQHIISTSEAKGPAAVSSRLWEQATAAARLSSKLGSDLGLDPIGHAHIRALSVGAEATQAGLSELQDRGRRHVERRNAELRPSDPAVGGPHSPAHAQPRGTANYQTTAQRATAN